MKWEGDIQGFLSIGYLYLILLGIASDTAFYSLIGINILSFSDILDVLISPLVHLTKNVVFPVFIGMIIISSYLLRHKITEKLEQKKTVATPEEKENAEQAVQKSHRWLLFISAVIFAAYLGLGIGAGLSMREKLHHGRIVPDHRITFASGETKDVKLIGNNSGYLFYVPEGGKNPVISPITDHMQHLERLP